MKLLLTSAGFTNQTIIDAFRGMLDRPTRELSIVVIPTGHNTVAGDKSWVFTEDFRGPFELGWKNFDIVDVAAVESLMKGSWWPKLEKADVILIGGGDTFYLSYWLQKSGLFGAMPDWLDSKVYVGISAGSMVASVSLTTCSESLMKAGILDVNDSGSSDRGDQSSEAAMELVDFGFRPHFGSARRSSITADMLQAASKRVKASVYALDDDTALKVVDGNIEVVSEGEWHLFQP